MSMPQPTRRHASARPDPLRVLPRSFRPFLLAAVAALLAGPSPAAELLLSVHEGNGPAPLPARIHVRDADGRPHFPEGLPRWHDHFVSEGTVRLKLPVGPHTLEVERGPEWTAFRTNLVVDATARALTASLSRIANLPAEGWWSGDTHVHRAPRDADLLLRAEDLHVAQFITWWNQSNPWTAQNPPNPPVTRLEATRWFHVLAGEDERDGGALLFHDLPRPLDITGATRHEPPSLVFAQAARRQGARWIEAEKPFWWDFPVWLAHGMADTVGIAHNHLQRAGVLDNEAWGRPRDRVRHPGPQGNGRWTQEIYYHALNCGLRLPPTAGSASGVLPNPVGYNRAYVHVDGEVTYEKWRDGLRTGRSFVSNGPLLRARANGEWPGHVFRTNGALTVLLEAKLDSRDPIAAVELVRNGQVERIQLPALITLHESGWFLLRAIADVPHTFRFASTAPFYVEIDGQPMRPRRDSVQFFLDWCRERQALLQENPEIPTDRREAILEPWRKTEAFWTNLQPLPATAVTGRVVDAGDGRPIHCRLYLQRDDGTWLFPVSADAAGSAIRYEKQNWNNRQAVERHTTLSAHPWRIELEPGHYTVTVERGPEYRPRVRSFTASREPVHLDLTLERWIHLAERGWYSGDTHVHRSLEELPQVMLAEDLNVAFPLNYWVTRGFEPPTQGDKSQRGEVPAGLIHVDDTHVIWPRNTEWEIFTLGGRPHTLGAVFALGHREPFILGAPPVRPIAAEARRQGALLDLDKHDWPWSLALVPLMQVDLFELANNHLWRTEFGFTNWNAPAPTFMGFPQPQRSGGERDWIEFTHRTYWTLLNCGYRLRPTAGTASGVHPVPLGFGRVYVHLPQGFSYEHWLAGLNEGRSFVTTGPMLLGGYTDGEATGAVFSLTPVKEVEVIVNGTLRHRLPLTPVRNASGAFEATFRHPLPLDGTSWVALRCWEEREAGRVRFAHTAPRWHDVPGKPLRPRREEAEYLVQRVRDEIARSAEILPAPALEDYRQALSAFERLLREAR